MPYAPYEKSNISNMEDLSRLSEQLEKMSLTIRNQLSNENLQQIIEGAIFPQVSQYIKNQLNSQIHSLIYAIVLEEVDKLNDRVNAMIAEIFQHQEKNADLLKSIQFHLSGQISPRKADRIGDAFEKKNFNEAFALWLALPDVNSRISYLACVNCKEINEGNLNKDIAMRLASWALSLDKVPQETISLITAMCAIIPKGPNANELLRKIVGKAEPLLADAKSLLIKKSLG